MPKRPILDVAEYAGGDTAPTPPRPAAPTPSPRNEDEATATVYARIPQSLFEKLRERCFELSKGKRRRVTQNDLMIAALRQYLGES
jgi:hypothetical protein